MNAVTRTTEPPDGTILADSDLTEAWVRDDASAKAAVEQNHSHVAPGPMPGGRRLEVCGTHARAAGGGRVGRYEVTPPDTEESR